jgi:hypothetical protein
VVVDWQQPQVYVLLISQQLEAVVVIVEGRAATEAAAVGVAPSLYPKVAIICLTCSFFVY